MNPRGPRPDSRSVCWSFLSVFCSFPACLSLKLCFTVVRLLAFLCDSVWPLVNPFLSQLALVEQLKSLLHTRLHLPPSPSLPLRLTFCCFPCLTPTCRIQCFSLCVHVLFTPTSSLSTSLFLACGSSPPLCFWTMPLLCPCWPMSA